MSDENYLSSRAKGRKKGKSILWKSEEEIDVVEGQEYDELITRNHEEPNRGERSTSMKWKAGGRKFSDYLATATIVRVVVGTGSAKKTFTLHAELLKRDTQSFERALQTVFKEGQESEVLLPEEDPALFGYYVEWLYQGGGWIAERIASVNDIHETEIPIIVRVYALGERLGCSKLQEDAMAKIEYLIHHSGNTRLTLSDPVLCDTLEIAATELPERVSEDPMRKFVFTFAAAKLSSLQKSPQFRALLRRCPDAGPGIAMNAGNGPGYSVATAPKARERTPFAEEGFESD